MGMRRAHFTDEDLTEWACRGLANQYRPDAMKHSNPNIRDGFEERAQKMERLADQLKWVRESHAAKAP
jgi:hypothetical protein